MRILFVGAEVAPLAKAGGMGDVIGALPKVLHQLGYDVRILMPYYGFLDDKIEIPSEPIWKSNAMSQEFSVHQTTLPKSNVPLYLLKHHSFAPRRIYGDDEYWRFTFFSNAAAEFAWNCWKPNIIHCHDWHTGMIPVWMHETPDITTVFTIHNLAYQGPGRGFIEHHSWCPWYMDGDNAMAAGIKFAGRITTVSPTYAQQIQTPAYGERLDGLLSYVNQNLVGILNGIDMDVYNPAEDQLIYQTFTPYTLEKRIANKIGLQEETGLEINKEAFVMGMVTRLVEQKGIDLILQILDRFMAHTNSQLVVLGSGDHYYENQLWQLSARYPGRVSVQILYNDVLSRRIFAGSDVFLMPSRFEPCGISQLFAMRYGCIPIVRRTGGLGDTVTFYDPIHQEGTGYCFDHYEPLDLLVCMIRAWEGFRFKADWIKLQQRCMNQDFSWYKSAAEYIKIYKELSGEPGQLTPEEQDKINALIKKNLTWNGNTDESLKEQVIEDQTKHDNEISEQESTETQTDILQETTNVEEVKPESLSSDRTSEVEDTEKEEEKNSNVEQIKLENSSSDLSSLESKNIEKEEEKNSNVEQIKSENTPSDLSSPENKNTEEEGKKNSNIEQIESQNLLPKTNSSEITSLKTGDEKSTMPTENMRATISLSQTNYSD
ncbi:glycogen synthase [Crocosphaera chwakensis CCY0110]|uniref:Glycogen synthase n=1 Tax=Crocosphaera chwakensis CCY0110 TaxID=391612 RepID=A3ILS2_9CHRO|nr:glycogen synthase GlgA [Crocosphaera chwakensis]EAZ92723.1 glycogen synthase [Crocosphaera chwakensis CCY0110]